jgi:hypothetical protein
MLEFNLGKAQRVVEQMVHFREGHACYPDARDSEGLSRVCWMERDLSHTPNLIPDPSFEALATDFMNLAEQPRI